MLTLIGASASGKTEIAKILIRDHGFQKLVTYTTREPRQGEKDGVDYHFLSMRAFLEKRARAEFVETTEYNGNLYGTSFNDVRHDRVVIVEPKGANALYEKLADRMVIVLLETPKSIRALRMISRGDDLDDIEKRLEADEERFDIHRLRHVDVVIENPGGSLEHLAKRIQEFYREEMGRRRGEN